MMRRHEIELLRAAHENIEALLALRTISTDMRARLTALSPAIDVEIREQESKSDRLRREAVSRKYERGCPD